MQAMQNKIHMFLFILLLSKTACTKVPSHIFQISLINICIFLFHSTTALDLKLGQNYMEETNYQLLAFQYKSEGALFSWEGIVTSFV